MSAIVPWTCPSCRGAVSTPYCPECGERPLRPHELTLRGLGEQVFEAFTNIDSRVLRSFRYLLTRPGFLTVAFLQGRRKPYLGPVPLFLVANVLFFAAESVSGGTVFSTPLDSHLHTQPWSPLAQTLVTSRLEALHTTMPLYAPRFDSAVALHARSLILLMALSFSILPLIVFRRGRHPFGAHAVFSLHLYAFMLLLFCVATMVPAVNLLHGGVRSTSEDLDHVLSIGLLVACAIYLYVAIALVYGGSRRRRVLQSIALTVAAAAIVLGYRFALLLITLYSA
jgi:Protein of unknown function (DUF3667)